MEHTFESAKSHEVFQGVLDRLIINQLCKDYNLDEHYALIETKDLIKAGWLASILANSPDEGHQFLAASFAKLLYLQNSEDETKSQLAYAILSRTGNLAASRHLKNLFESDSTTGNLKFRRSFGSALDIEIGTKRNTNKLVLQGETLFLTDFQRELWRSLNEHDHVAISAPTSAGKSFFVQHFITSLFATHESFKVIYIVPSKALITQSSESFKELFKNYEDVSIKTSYVEADDTTVISDGEKIYSKVIYCITPERCLRLLQEGWQGGFKPDLVFIDEIQNVETGDSRAVLLEYVLTEINKLWTNLKIIFAGPFINNGPELFKKLFNIPADDMHTYLPPVYQLKLTLQLKDENKLSILVHLRGDKTFEIKLNKKIELASKAGKSMLAPIIKFFGRPDGNLIYAAKTNWCVAYAMDFIKSLHSSNGRPTEVDPRIDELIDFIKDDIHPDYALIYCLRYKVGFHHGKLPDIVKNEIESLFTDGLIEYLFCTSTLLQGVNLPAARIFIIYPKKESQDLTHFDFGNLVGRAGRISNSMIGTIFCLEKDWENDSWSNEYYSSEYTKSVVPTSDKVLKNVTDEIVSILNRQPKYLKHSGEESTLNLIKQRYLENPEEARNFLSSKDVGDTKSQAIMARIEDQLRNVKIPKDVARLNPGMDPVLQNILYEQIKNDGVNNWVIHDEEVGNQHFNKFMRRSEAEKLEIKDRPFYYQLESLGDRMDRMFAIWKEASMKNSGVKSIRQMIFHGMNWMDGHSLAKLIQKEIDSENPPINQLGQEARILAINECINRLININSIVVTFILVKYFKILGDLLESLMDDKQKILFRRTLLLPTMLEVGSRKIDVISMISRGIPRSIAIRLSPCIPESHKMKPIEWLQGVTNTDTLSIKTVYCKYLIRKGFMPGLLKKDKR